MGNVAKNCGENSRQIKCPESAHEEWMSVSKKGWKNQKSIQKKQTVSNQQQSCGFGGNQGEKKGHVKNTSNSNVNFGIPHEGPIRFNAGIKINETPNPLDTQQGRKRGRKESNTQGAQPGLSGEVKSATPMGTSSQQGQQSKPPPKTRMIGDKRVFVFDDGTQTTLNLQHQVGNCFVWLADEDVMHEQGNEDTITLHMTGASPFDPGASSSDNPQSRQA